MTENEISSHILDAAFRAHTKLGPGLFESVYEVILAYELKTRGLMVERQKPMPIMYDDIRFDEAFRSDMVVNGKVIAQLKSGSAPSRSREAGSYPVAPERIKTGLAHQFRRGASEEWHQTNHQWQIR
jgi:GxxExxY protein